MRNALTVKQKAEIRRRAARGESQISIAARIGCSQATVSRVIHDEETPASMTGPLSLAAAAYLDALNLDGEQLLRAAALKLLAAKIDWASASPAVGAATALPGLAREFTAMLSALEPERENVAEQVERLLRPLRVAAHG